MTDTSKNKAKQKNPKRKSAEAIQQHEPLVQDRIAGMAIKDLAEKYKLHRDTVSSICKEHKARINEAREAYLSDRQEKINQAMDADTENLVRLLGKGTALLERMIDETNRMLDEINESDKKLKPGIVFEGVEAVTKAFDRIRASVLAQQKQAVSD